MATAATDPPAVTPAPTVPAPDRTLVAKLFPFLLVLDRDLRIVEHGRAVPKICPEIALGKGLTELFVVQRPKLASTWEKLVREAEGGATVLLGVRSTSFRLRGQLVHDPASAQLVFAGGPWFTSLDELERSALSLDELPGHDPTVDFLSMVQAKAMALDDARRFGEALARQRDELEATNEKLTQTLRELEDKLAAIEEQRRAIRGLSTPVIEVWEGFLCLPVVGTLSVERAAEMTDALLREATAKGARGVIVDLTGIDAIDATTADHLLQLTRSLACIGTPCILTGIRGAVARTLVELGVDMAELTTKRSLRVALRHFVQRGEDATKPART
jgi:rsbT co-antagonist protein RsbR